MIRLCVFQLCILDFQSLKYIAYDEFEFFLIDTLITFDIVLIQGNECVDKDTNVDSSDQNKSIPVSQYFVYSFFLS